jgi:hypothetical protein
MTSLIDGLEDVLPLLEASLYKRYKVIEIPTPVWNSSNVGSGGVYGVASSLAIWTGTTANSRGLAFLETFGLNSGDRYRTFVDYGKRLIWTFSFDRENSDPECIGRIQLKQTSTEGALANVGIGLEIQNFSVYAESYGTARQTTLLGTLTIAQIWSMMIVHVPGSRVEFWVNRTLAAVHTQVPTGVSAATYHVVSIVNGSTGEVNCVLRIGPQTFIQEW